jgi:hypothetical protein
MRLHNLWVLYLVAVNSVAPEQLYASQLSQLQEMGFLDTQENVRALVAVGGNAWQSSIK